MKSLCDFYVQHPPPPLNNLFKDTLHGTYGSYLPRVLSHATVNQSQPKACKGDYSYHIPQHIHIGNSEASEQDLPPPLPQKKLK